MSNILDIEKEINFLNRIQIPIIKYIYKKEIKIAIIMLPILFILIVLINLMIKDYIYQNFLDKKDLISSLMIFLFAIESLILNAAIISAIYITTYINFSKNKTDLSPIDKIKLFNIKNYEEYLYKKKLVQLKKLN